ncbi:hypothetical protein DPMN_086813 [Dreissena polymorpha]|uniref:Uncharacterized protein n=1 Tax=Dreissena polymorpha TaxID=45954 RepID=A0A9D4KRV1_DREPO|nr:hypothetical protein DPMN_086813 [Dreissena polymorpha]
MLTVKEFKSSKKPPVTCPKTSQSVASPSQPPLGHSLGCQRLPGSHQKNLPPQDLPSCKSEAKICKRSIRLNRCLYQKEGNINPRKDEVTCQGTI